METIKQKYILQDENNTLETIKQLDKILVEAQNKKAAQDILSYIDNYLYKKFPLYEKYKYLKCNFFPSASVIINDKNIIK